MADRTPTIDDPIPHVLTKRQLAAHLQISEHQVDEYRRLKNHPAIKELEGPGHVRFSGRALKTWLDGGRAAPAARQYFRKARRNEERPRVTAASQHDDAR